MKDVLLFVALLIGSISFGQTIMVNGSPMLVDDQTSFPFWLESGSSISPETSVSVISVLEFNLKSNSDGNDMIFNQVLSLSSESSVPEGKVWKVESVLKLDLNFNNESDTSSVLEENSDDLNSNLQGSGVPVGTILSFAGNSAPEGYLICDGTVISSSTYSDLFSVITNLYGEGDGSYTLQWVDVNDDEIMDPEEMINISSTFNLPNLRGRTIIGVDTTGDIVSNTDSIGKYGGEETHMLSEDELPEHSHSIAGYTSQSNSWDVQPGYQYSNPNSSTNYAHYYGQTGNAGGNQPHNNMQPYLVTNYIIKY